jgi:hypothetical protein
MIDLENPEDFLDSLINTYSRYFWMNSNENEASIGIKNTMQVCLEYGSLAHIHLYADDKFVLTNTYPIESAVGDKVKFILVLTKSYLTDNTKFDYQNYYAKILIIQSEQIINYYFKDK